MYILEEVVASLKNSLRKQRLEESYFWLEELELSCEEELVKDILLEMWTMRKGVVYWPWLLTWCEVNTTIHGRRYLVKLFCNSGKVCDSSIYISYVLSTPFLGGGSVKLNETLMKVVNVLETCGTNLCKCIVSWVKLLKPSMCPTNTYKGEMLNQGLNEEWNIHDLEESIANVGLRASRKFGVGCEVHYGNTQRGLDVGTELISTHLYTLLEHPVWAGLLEPFVTDENEWKSEESKEAFYDTYFGISGDIPDEWPKSEREKSHGLPPASRSVFYIQRWWSTWIPEEHLYVFGKELLRLEELLKKAITEPVPDYFEKNYGHRTAEIYSCKEYVFED
jgi:hypothetical protein